MDSFTQTYQTDMSLELGKLTLSAHISSSPGDCLVTLSQPQSLAGYSYLFRDDGADMSYKNLTFSLNATSETERGNAPPLAEAVRALRELLAHQPGVLLKKQDGYWELAGEVNGIPSAIWIDDANGTPMKLLLHDGETEIKFENFSFYD